MMKRIMIMFSLVWSVFLLTLSLGTIWNTVCVQSNSKVRIAPQEKKNTIGNNIREVLLEKCAFREAMIHFYGDWARITGRSLCNDVIRHQSGMLLNVKMPYVDTTNHANKIRYLRNNLKKMGKEFFYVQLPLKSSRINDMLPRGFAIDCSHEIIDDFIKKLNIDHIPLIDTRGALDLTSEHLNRYFFKTDHHWNFDGAFRVFPIIAQALVTQVECDSSDIFSYTSSQQWDRMKLPHKFCGSVGRRTGVLFSGLDDLFYYIPKFMTEITKVISSKRVVDKGSFEYSVINISNLKKPQSTLLDNAYALYGGDYDHVKYLNSMAPIKKSLLVVKDSYALPIIAWLTTIFERIDVLDLRYLKRMTVLEASEVFESDIVVIMYNPGSIDVKKMWEFGSAFVSKVKQSRCYIDTVSISKSKHPYNHVVLQSNVLGGGLYKISAKYVESTVALSDKVSICLLDKKSGKVIQSAIMPFKALEWVVDIPKGKEYLVALYPSEAGKCAGVGAIWHDVEICCIK